MNISPVGTISLPISSIDNSSMKNSGAEFEATLYRALLQNIDWTSSVIGERQAEHTMFGTMISDFLAQEMARQQNGFGSMLLKTMDAQGEGWQ